MTTAPFRAIHPLTDLSQFCGAGNRQLRTNAGLMEFRTTQLDGRTVTLPTRFVTVDGSASAEFRDNGVSLLFRRRGLEVVLDSDGIFVGERFEGRLERPSLEMTRRATHAIVTDGGVQRAFLGLARGLWASTLETVAATGSAVPGSVYEHVQAVGDTYASMTRPATVTTCETETVVETITEQVYGWVDHVTTAVEQAHRCTADCTAKHPVAGWWDWEGAAALALCLGGCALGLFNDIVTSTYELIATVTREVISYITHCTEVPVTWPPSNGEGPQRGAGFPSSVGKIHPDEVTGNQDLSLHVSGVINPNDIRSVVQPVLPALLCIAGGEWSTWDVDVPDLGIGVDAAPVGLRVCVDRQCLDTIRGTLTFDLLLSTAGLLAGIYAAQGAEAAAATILSALPSGVSAAINAVATALGISVGTALAAVLVLLILIVYNLAAIVAQVKIRELFGESFANGVCLQHPIIALGAIALVTGPTVVGPFLAAQIAANTPLIVVPR